MNTRVATTSVARRLARLLLVAAASCGSALTPGPTVAVAPPPAPPSPSPSPSIIIASPSPAAPGGECTATLAIEASAISSQTCRIDSRVTGRPGLLVYPCGGGPAQARFDRALFAGEVRADGTIALELTTRFPFRDGCSWQSVQRIAGSLGARRLGYRYDEAPLPGQAGCADACEAAAMFDVQ